MAGLDLVGLNCTGWGSSGYRYQHFKALYGVVWEEGDAYVFVSHFIYLYALDGGRWGGGIGVDGWVVGDGNGLGNDEVFVMGVWEMIGWGLGRVGVGWD